ncbi:hypothetical protein ACER0C_013292 [Sarotherodon galilaeus]
MKCEEEESLNDPEVYKQERNFGLSEDGPQLPQIKEEQEEVCTSQDAVQVVVKQESEEIFVWTGKERFRVLDNIWKHEEDLHCTDPPQCDCKDKEGLTDQQVCNQEKNSSLDQEDSSQIKEEQEELSTTQVAKPLVRKQEAFPAHEENDHSEPEPSSDQLLSHNSPDTDQEENKDDNSHRKKSDQVVAGLRVQNSKTNCT